MAEPSRARASIQDIRKAEILNATKWCIAERGLNQTTLRDIAEYAETTASSVLYYFQSKEDLVLAAVADASDELRHEVERQLAEKTSAIQKLETICRLTLASTGTAFRLWLEIRAQAVRDSFVRATYIGKYEQWLRLVERVVQEGIDAGELPDTNAKTTATVLSAGIDGVAFYLLMDPSADREQLTEWCIHSLHALIAASPSSQSPWARAATGREQRKV